MTSVASPGVDNDARTNDQLWRSVRIAALNVHSQATGTVTRSEYAASLLANLAQRNTPGARLGTKVELREMCEVSVGTFNEAVKLAQSRGYVTSRPGPGGGIFAAEQSPIVRLGNSVLALDGSATSVADAVRMRDALDPLLVEDALWHSSATDLRSMRNCLVEMSAAMEANDPTAFIRGNWALHARIAAVSPSAILRSVYVSLLELIETHTLSVHAAEAQPLPDFISHRFDIHVTLVDAIEQRDPVLAVKAIHEHNTTTSG